MKIKLLRDIVRIKRMKALERKLCKVVSKLTGNRVVTVLKYGAVDKEIDNAK